MADEQGGAIPPSEDRAVVNGAGQAVSVPSADGSNWSRRTVAVWEEWRFGDYRAFKTNFDGPWHLQNVGSAVFTAHSLGAEHESAVPQGCAPKGDA